MRSEELPGLRTDWVLAAALALGFFALYAATAPRTVALEDDGLFILSSRFLGIEHPPGFPVHTLLGKLFTLLPVGSVAFRLHLLSAVFGALSVALLWFCGRAAGLGRLAASVAGMSLGLSPVFWSQSIIAEVYTLNAFFAFLLLFGILRAANGAAGNMTTGRWSALALLYGFSLANHWPLMLLLTPAYAILLWPTRRKIASMSPWLAAMVLVGLAPYVWLVLRSWAPLPISYYGPIDTLREFWFFLSREGYQGVDVSPTAGWADRIRFLGFQGEQVLVQFAGVGAVFAVIGGLHQWRTWGTRQSAALTAGFLLPTVGLLLLLGFDYGALYKHVFHVYPLPAYGVVALWLGLGFEVFTQRFRTHRWVPALTVAALGSLMLWWGSQLNLRANYDWSDRYAKAVLESLPAQAILMVHKDAEIGSVGYWHIVQGMRPDVTLVQPEGLIFGNRLFDPVHTPDVEKKRRLRSMIESETRPVASTREFPAGMGQIDHGLYFLYARPASADKTAVEVSDTYVRFCAANLQPGSETDPWTVFMQQELRRRCAGLLAMGHAASDPKDSTRVKFLNAVTQDFHGALGIAEGLLASRAGFVPGQVAFYLARALETMPSDGEKSERARVPELLAYLSVERGDVRAAIENLEASIAIWPTASNPAVPALADLYRKGGNTPALDALLRLP